MVKIVADSTCDLSKEIIDKYNIVIIPLHIVLNDAEYRDGIEITQDEIYKWSDENKTTPKTSAVGVEDTIDALKPIIDNDDEAIIFSISDSMSTTYNVFKMAVEELDAENVVSVINSQNLSTGIGLLVMKAVIMAKEGKTRSEIVKEIEKLKELVRASFVVDTLVYLHRGGRCSSVAALAGGMLKLHPKIVVKDGKMDANKKYRGKMDSVIMNYVKDIENDLKGAYSDRVFITHSGCDEDIINKVYDYIKEMNYFEDIIVTRAGGVISSHCGPGTFGVLYIAQK